MKTLAVIYVLAGLIGLGAYLIVALGLLYVGAPGAVPALVGLAAWLAVTLWALVWLGGLSG